MLLLLLMLLMLLLQNVPAMVVVVVVVPAAARIGQPRRWRPSGTRSAGTHAPLACSPEGTERGSRGPRRSAALVPSRSSAERRG